MRIPSGQIADDAALAAVAMAILATDPAGMGGAVLRGPPGPAREAFMEGLRHALPEQTPFRIAPSSASDDRILGGIDLGASLTRGRRVLLPGLLAEADGGFLVLQGAERMSAARAASIGAAQDRGETLVERDGLAARIPSRFAFVAFDEGRSDDEGCPEALRDRAGLHVDVEDASGILAAFGGRRRQEISAARSRIRQVSIDDGRLASLCEAAQQMAVTSIRAAVFAMKAAIASCALDGRCAVNDDDIMLAARLVLLPRAAALPSPPDAQERHDPPPADEQPQSAEKEATEGGTLADRVIESVRAALPADLLARLAGAGGVRAGGGKNRRSQLRARTARRGRPIGARQGELRSGERLDVIETLRAAAPWQKLRKGDGSKIRLVRGDFRTKRFRQRSETTAIFAVDASGSAAIHRLAEAKGAVELLLADCYVRRDKVAVVAFRGTQSELLLPPTRSLQRARRALVALPGGGGTPLCAGIEAAARIAEQVVQAGGTPVLVFLTDGRANIARDGRADRAAAMADAQAAARTLRQRGHAALLIDISPHAGPAAQAIAAEMAASYLPLPNADARGVSAAVAGAMKGAVG